MDAKRFVSGLGALLERDNAPLPDVGKSAMWTGFMLDKIVDLAEANSMHVCASRLGRTHDPRRHMSREYLFDLTIYDADRWKMEWSLPNVIVEHENAWNEGAFLADFWKLQLGFAPLRVMIGYAQHKAAVDALAKTVVEVARTSRWTQPDGTEDLVLLRCPVAWGRAEGMPWPRWRIVYRNLNEWRDLGERELVGTTL